MRNPLRLSARGVPVIALLSIGAVAACTAGGGDDRLAHDREALSGAGGAGVGVSTVQAVTATSGFSVSTSVAVGVGVGGGSFGVGVGGGSFGAGGGSSGGGGPMPVGFWKFDDCAESSTTLADSSGFGNTATRTSSAPCVLGIQGAAVNFSTNKDEVTVPNALSFAFTDHVAVAAWIKPTTVSGTQTIVTQQGKGKTTFALTIQDQTVEFSLTLQNGDVITSSAPITAGVWSHVAGTYDGHFLFLYLDGQQVGQVDSPGSIKDAMGPISIGNDPNNKHFDGAIDDVWISTDPVQLSDIAALACIQMPPTFAVTPASGPPSPPTAPSTTASSSPTTTPASARPSSTSSSPRPRRASRRT